MTTMTKTPNQTRPLIAPPPEPPRAHERPDWLDALPDLPWLQSSRDAHRAAAAALQGAMRELLDLRAEHATLERQYAANVEAALRAGKPAPARPTNIEPAVVSTREAIAREKVECERDRAALAAVDALALLRGHREAVPAGVELPPDAVRAVQAQRGFDVAGLPDGLREAITGRRVAVAVRVAETRWRAGEITPAAETLDETGLTRRTVSHRIYAAYNRVEMNPWGEPIERSAQARLGEEVALRPWEAARLDVAGALAPCGATVGQVTAAAEQLTHEHFDASGAQYGLGELLGRVA